MSEAELDESYLDDMIAQHERSIRVFKEHLIVKVQNLDAFVLDETESIRSLQGLIEKHGQALHHLLSTRMRRKSSGSTPDQEPHAQAVQERDEEQERLRKIFEAGKPAPGFPVEPPPDADRGQFFTTWTSDASPEWSPGDHIDEHGNRHVRRKGRHKIWNKHGQLVSDQADTSTPTEQTLKAEDQAAFDWLKKMGYVDDNGEPTEAGKAAMKKPVETPPDTANGVS